MLQGTWGRLQRLDLSMNCLAALPSNMSLLTSLIFLNMAAQNADLQISEPFKFQSSMKSLQLCQASYVTGREHVWSAASVLHLQSLNELMRRNANIQTDCIGF